MAGATGRHRRAGAADHRRRLGGLSRPLPLGRGAGHRRRQCRHQPQRGPGLRPAAGLSRRRPRELRPDLALHRDRAPSPRRRPRRLEMGPEGRAAHHRRQQCERRRRAHRLCPRPRRRRLGRGALPHRRRGDRDRHRPDAAARGPRPGDPPARRRRLRAAGGRERRPDPQPLLLGLRGDPGPEAPRPGLRLGRAHRRRDRPRRRGALRQGAAADRLGRDRGEGPPPGARLPAGLRLQRDPHPALSRARRRRRRPAARAVPPDGGAGRRAPRQRRDRYRRRAADRSRLSAGRRHRRPHPPDPQPPPPAKAPASSPTPDELKVFRPTNYYPSTLQLLGLAWLAERQPPCR